ncbi:MAG: ATP-binding protein [Bryobacterales bacterium]|nr:ATP-binding protein [Bryobacterales bacterium]MDE0627180.1 ATP-binding protein [Bryobacterales bacterium]
MKTCDELRQEIEAQRDGLSRLSEASVRVSESLEVGTVMAEVVGSARRLTGARYGAVMTVDESGRPRDWVFSGLTGSERRSLLEWREGTHLLEHFQGLPRPPRIPDLQVYAATLGIAANPLRVKTFLGTPIVHRGVRVGHFFLGQKEGARPFTDEDEEILVLFASQAATAITNARTYRAERRARADLEALVDTSPVGVVVFEARTGRPVLLNREAKRFAGVLGAPGEAPELLLEVLTCRFSGGREISLDELPLAEELGNATTTRAEEIVLKAPGGRSVTTLVNATPIRAEDGTVESVVVTLQDLAPLEELERLRAEFLGMVSHELRAPLTSVIGSAATALRSAPDLPRAETRQLLRIIEEQAAHMHGLIGDLLDAGRIEAGALSVSPEPAELAGLVERARRTFQSGGGRHALRIDLPPDLPLVQADRERVVQVLNNLFSNAARHSPEMSPIRVAAERDGPHVAVSVTDEGRGVPPDLLPHLFRKHARVGGGRERGIRGSGLGLAICKGLVEAHGGRIRAESGGVGLGTRFTFTLPAAESTGGRAADGPPRRSGGSPADGRGLTRVLVVDDDPQTLKYVRDALAMPGYTTLSTVDPQEVSRLLGTRRPHLVLLDLLMPGTDGIELMEQVPGLGDLPVIFISGYGRDETIARAAGRSLRLHRQALLADGAGGADRGGPAPLGRAVRLVRAGRAGRPLRGTPRDGRGPTGDADGHRIRAAARPRREHGTGVDVRLSAAPGVEREGQGRPATGAHLCEAAPPEAGRRRRQPRLHRQPAPGGLPDGAARRSVSPTSRSPGPVGAVRGGCRVRRGRDPRRLEFGGLMSVRRRRSERTTKTQPLQQLEIRPRASPAVRPPRRVGRNCACPRGTPTVATRIATLTWKVQSGPDSRINIHLDSIGSRALPPKRRRVRRGRSPRPTVIPDTSSSSKLSGPSRTCGHVPNRVSGPMACTVRSLGGEHSPASRSPAHRDRKATSRAAERLRRRERMLPCDLP